MIKEVGKNFKGLMFILIINWLIKLFLMVVLGWLFFEGLFVDFVSFEMV